MDPVESFGLDEFLARPLVARVATNGPEVRPVWYLWEEGAFWWLTGGWSSLPQTLERDPLAALVVDTCDLDSGQVLVVTASGRAGLLPFDAGRARRKLVRYLGGDENKWDPRFEITSMESNGTAFVRLVPDKLRARDLSYRPSSRT
jgi:nitroimidazol reductase NimA-like FMN-containing flavoprotein (pyridoxamine 5'-phosphate oxidase superfamily)